MKTTTVELFVKRTKPGTTELWFKRCEVRVLETTDGEVIGVIAEHVDRHEKRHLEPLEDREKDQAIRLAKATK